MMHLAKKTATAALIVTAVATPTAVALHQDDDAGMQSSIKLVGETWIRAIEARRAALPGLGLGRQQPQDRGVRDKYEKQFQQDSVLRTDSTEHVSF